MGGGKNRGIAGPAKEERKEEMGKGGNLQSVISHSYRKRREKEPGEKK